MTFTKLMSLWTAYLQWYCCTIFLTVLEQLQGRLAHLFLSSVIPVSTEFNKLTYVISMSQCARLKWTRCWQPRRCSLGGRCCFVDCSLFSSLGEHNSSSTAPLHWNCIQQRGGGCRLCHQNGTRTFHFSHYRQPPRSPFRYPCLSHYILSVTS